MTKNLPRTQEYKGRLISESVRIFERDGEDWGEDEYGQFPMSAGSKEPVDDEDRCGCTLKLYMERYGEVRYCTMLSGKVFNQDFEFCKNHKHRSDLHAQTMKNFKHGARSQNYSQVFQYLEPHKQLSAIDVYEDLLERSVYEFDTEDVEWEIDTSNVVWADADSSEVKYPVPTENAFAAKQLWVASLLTVMEESISEQLFADAVEDGVGVGERIKVVTVTDDGYEVTDEAEHHLNLQLSRIISKQSDLLEQGGVGVDDAEEAKNEQNFTMNFGPDKKPETKQTIGEDPFDSNVDTSEE